MQTKLHENSSSSGRISSLTACLFVVGEMTGAALLAMPDAMRSSGWYCGPVLMILTCIASAYCGILLSKCWLILESGDPSFRQTTTRNPYAVVGEKACGAFGYYSCLLSLIVTLFGTCVVQILVCSEMLQSLVPVQISFCQWILVVGLCLMPFSFFGSPADFYPVAFFAMSSTSIAGILILIALATIATNATTNTEAILPNPKDVSPSSVLLGLMSMCFAFSGTSCMPTIQNDMRDKQSFGKSIIFAYLIMIALYLPVSALGFYKTGHSVQSNIVQNLQPSILRTSIEVLMAAHVLCAYLILINPVNLNIENMIGIRHSLNIWRCLSRSLVILLAIVTALTVQKFGKLLPIVGASTTLIQTFILPSVFYYYLMRQHRQITKLQSVPSIILVIAGVAGAIFGTYIAIDDLLKADALVQPCYSKC